MRVFSSLFDFSGGDEVAGDFMFWFYFYEFWFFIEALFPRKIAPRPESTP